MRIEPVPQIFTGKITIGSTPTPFPATETNTPKFAVAFKAPSGNSGTIYIGGSDVSSSNGYPVEKGQECVIEIANPGVLTFAGTQNDVLFYMIK